MYMNDGTPVYNKTNIEISMLLIIIVLVFILFVGALVLLMFKLIYTHLEEQFLEDIEQQKQNTELLPSAQGIRPISAILPPAINSQLDAIFESRRGAGFPIRHPERHIMNKSFVSSKKVEFADLP